MVETGKQWSEEGEERKAEGVSEEPSLGITGGSRLKASWVVSLLFQLPGSLGSSHQIRHQ